MRPIDYNSHCNFGSRALVCFDQWETREYTDRPATIQTRHIRDAAASLCSAGHTENILYSPAHVGLTDSPLWSLAANTARELHSVLSNLAAQMRSFSSLACVRALSCVTRMGNLRRMKVKYGDKFVRKVSSPFRSLVWFAKSFGRANPQLMLLLLRIAMCAPLNDGSRVNLNPRLSWLSRFWKKCSNGK